MHKDKRGFTLLELIIVVIVIGILASIALPRYIRIAEKGRAAEAKALLGQLRSAQMRYSAEHGIFTGSYTDLDASFTPGRYFTISSIGGPNVGNPAEQVAAAQRNSLDVPFGAGGAVDGYWINITQAGDFINDSISGQYM